MSALDDDDDIVGATSDAAWDFDDLLRDGPTFANEYSADAQTAADPSRVRRSYKTHRKNNSSQRFDSLGSFGSLGSIDHLDWSGLQDSTENFDEAVRRQQPSQQHLKNDGQQSQQQHHRVSPLGSPSTSPTAAGSAPPPSLGRRHKSNLSQVGRDLLMVVEDSHSPATAGFGHHRQLSQGNERHLRQEPRNIMFERQRRHSDGLSDVAHLLNSDDTILGSRPAPHFTTRAPPSLAIPDTTDQGQLSPQSAMSHAFAGLNVFDDADPTLGRMSENGSNFVKTQRFGMAASSGGPSVADLGARGRSHVRMHSSQFSDIDGFGMPLYPSNLAQMHTHMQAALSDEDHERMKQKVKAANAKRNRPRSMAKVTRAPTFKRGAATTHQGAGRGSRHSQQKSMPKVFERANMYRGAMPVADAGSVSLGGGRDFPPMLLPSPATSPLVSPVASPTNASSGAVPHFRQQPEQRRRTPKLTASTASSGSSGRARRTVTNSSTTSASKSQASAGVKGSDRSRTAGATASSKAVPQNAKNGASPAAPAAQPAETGRRRKAIPWTEEEDRRLLEMVAKTGPQNWRSIANYVGSRTPAQVAQRWRKILNPELLKVNKGKWTPAEDDRLRLMISRHGTDWHRIAEGFDGTRTVKHCRERWLKHISPDLKRNEPWTKEEDQTLLKVRQKLGYNGWAEIAKSLPGRTDNAVKRRYRSLTNPRTLNLNSAVRAAKAASAAPR